MGVFPQDSDWLQSDRYEIWASSEDKDEKGMVSDGRTEEHIRGFPSALAKLILGTNLSEAIPFFYSVWELCILPPSVFEQDEIIG